MNTLTVLKLKVLLEKLDASFRVVPTESGIVFLNQKGTPKAVIDTTGRMMAFNDQRRDGLQLDDKVSVVKHDDPNPISGNLSE